MQILLISHFYPPKHNSGTENYTYGLAQAFQKKGHDVSVLSAEDWHFGENYWNGVTTDIYDGVPVDRIHLNWTEAKNPNRVLYDSLPVEKWMEAYLDEKRPNVAHITSTYSLGVGIMRALAKANVPFALSLMDFWFLCARTVLMRSNGDLCDGNTSPWECQQCLLSTSNLFSKTRRIMPEAIQPIIWKNVSKIPALASQNGLRGHALDMVERKMLMHQSFSLPNVILSHSEFVKQMFEQAQMSEEIKHLANGHELSWLKSYHGKRPSSRLRIGYMGQISHTKGVHTLIEAFKTADLDEYACLKLWGDLTKDDSYTNKLIDLIGNSQHIQLEGRFDRNQLADVLADIDVLVVPSIWYENAPLVIYEAFATQTPVIATDLGGMSEAISDEENGLLFERGNAQDLARQLRRLVFEDGLLNSLIEQIPTVKSIGEEVEELEEIYLNIISAKRIVAR